MTVTNTNDIREEVKSRINMGNSLHIFIQLRKFYLTAYFRKKLKINTYETIRITLPVVLYSCETWPLTFREEQSFRVIKNKVLRKIFGAKRDEITGEWTKLT